MFYHLRWHENWAFFQFTWAMHLLCQDTCPYPLTCLWILLQGELYCCFCQVHLLWGYAQITETRSQRAPLEAKMRVTAEMGPHLPAMILYISQMEAGIEKLFNGRLRRCLGNRAWLDCLCPIGHQCWASSYLNGHTLPLTANLEMYGTHKLCITKSVPLTDTRENWAQRIDRQSNDKSGLDHQCSCEPRSCKFITSTN